jgi:hypothetical protein
MDASVTAGYASIISGVRKRRPAEYKCLLGSDAGLDLRTARRNRYRIAKPITSCPGCQYRSGRGTVGTVTRYVIREWRRRKRCRLVGNPLRTIHFDRAFRHSSASARRRLRLRDDPKSGPCLGMWAQALPGCTEGGHPVRASSSTDSHGERIGVDPVVYYSRTVKAKRWAGGLLHTLPGSGRPHRPEPESV